MLQSSLIPIQPIYPVSHHCFLLWHQACTHHALRRSLLSIFSPMLFPSLSLYLSVFLPPSPFLNSWIAQPEIIAAELALPTTEKRCQPSRSIVAPHVAGTMTTALAPADSGPSLTPVTEKDVLMFWWDGDYNAPRAKIWILHILRCAICGKSKKCGGKKCMLSYSGSRQDWLWPSYTLPTCRPPTPPTPHLVFPSQHPATKRWGSVSLLWDHIQSVWVVCFPSADRNGFAMCRGKQHFVLSDWCEVYFEVAVTQQIVQSRRRCR